MTWTFRPASSFKEQHGLFVALIGTTNSGKTYSALRLARGIAGPKGKIAVLDTEGGRTLHLKDDFAFDVIVMNPPHRPGRYLEAAQSAQEQGYDVLVIDSFSMEWRGIGGVLDWMEEELTTAVEGRRRFAESKGWQFDEAKERLKMKQAASIRPKMEHKLMVFGFLGLRMPIVFSIRGETAPDPDDMKKEIFRAQTNKQFPFELTVSFRLASNAKGVIDLTDPAGWKMEKAHQEIFRNGDLLAEEHGARLIAWARGGEQDAAKAYAEKFKARLRDCETVDAYSEIMDSEAVGRNLASLKENRPELYAEIRAVIDETMMRLTNRETPQ